MKTLFFKPLLLLLLLLNLVLKVSAQVTLEGKQFKLNGNDFYPMVLCDIIEFAVDDSDPNNLLIFPGPHPQMGVSFNYDSFNAQDAVQDIRNDMKRIKDLGFNCIRWTGMVPIYKTYCNKFYFQGATLSGAGAYNPLTTIPCTPQAVHNGPQYYLWVNSISASDPMIIAYFAAIDTILSIAAEPDIDLQVMIDFGYGDIAKSTTAINDYSTLLTLAAQHMVTAPHNDHFMAYIVVEEPLYTYDLAINNKQTICDITNNWYNLIHTIDTGHLISMSTYDVKEVIGWDPDVMRCDFLQPHFYPLRMPYETSAQSGTDRVLGSIKWFSEHCPMPWMVGEAGLRASDAWNSAAPNTITLEGTEAEQVYFAQQTLSAVRDWGGSGYAWWNLQETWWTKEPFGIVKKASPMWPPNSADEKPVASIFRNYLNPTTHQPPAIGSSVLPSGFNPADPYDHNVPAAQLANTISGTVIDQDGNPIENAVAVGATYLEPNLNPLLDPIYDFHYVFTDNNGHFDIIPYDFSVDGYVEPMHGNVEMMQISASGAERRFINELTPVWPGYVIQAPITNNQIFTIKQNDFNFDGIVPNNTTIGSYTIGLTENRKFKGWNSLLALETTIAGIGTTGGIADFSARSDVYAASEFHAQLGSEVHLFTETTLWDCMDADFSLYNKSFGTLANSTNSSHDVDGIVSEIEIQFKEQLGQLILKISPNPSSGIFIVDVTGAQNEAIEYELSDVAGRQIISAQSVHNHFELNLTNYSPGIYFFKTRSNNFNAFQKIVISK